MKFPSPLALLALVPGTLKTLAAELRAAHAVDSDGGAKVTRAEVEHTVAAVGLRIADAFLPLFLTVNGLERDAG